MITPEWMSADDIISEALKQPLDIPEVLGKEFKVPQDHESILKILFDNRGVVCGGYIRDLLIRVQPRDMDVIVSEDYMDGFVCGMIHLGYKIVESNGTDHVIYGKPGQISLDVWVSPDNPQDVLLGYITDPDYDVNVLTWGVTEDGKKSQVYSWCEKVKSISDLVDQIKQGRALELSPYPERKLKFAAKKLPSVKSWDVFTAPREKPHNGLWTGM